MPVIDPAEKLGVARVHLDDPRERLDRARKGTPVHRNGQKGQR